MLTDAPDRNGGQEKANQQERKKSKSHFGWIQFFTQSFEKSSKFFQIILQNHPNRLKQRVHFRSMEKRMKMRLKRRRLFMKTLF